MFEPIVDNLSNKVSVLWKWIDSDDAINRCLRHLMENN